MCSSPRSRSRWSPACRRLPPTHPAVPTHFLHKYPLSELLAPSISFSYGEIPFLISAHCLFGFKTKTYLQNVFHIPLERERCDLIPVWFLEPNWQLLIIMCDSKVEVTLSHVQRNKKCTLSWILEYLLCENLQMKKPLDFSIVVTEAEMSPGFWVFSSMH